MKRKYTRHALQLKISPHKRESSGNLPPDILASIEKILGFRKSLGLFDDREERTERALRYQEFMGKKNGI